MLLTNRYIQSCKINFNASKPSSKVVDLSDLRSCLCLFVYHRNRIMWQRPLLAVVYVAAVVAVTWILEFTLWWDSGLTTQEIINPLKQLSVSQIQALLDARGIQYTSLLEKSEIIDLLHQSGPVQFGELWQITSVQETKGPIEIINSDEYYEQVFEDSESLWLVEVVPGEGQYAGHHLLDEKTWFSLAPKFQRLGIHSAIMRCQYDNRFCAHQGWSHSQLVLLLPSSAGTRSRKHLAITSTTHLSASTVTTWLYDQIIAQTKVIENVESLEHQWLNKSRILEKSIPNLVFISELLSPPLLIATVGLRFSSRLKLAVFSVKKEEKSQVTQLLKRHRLSGSPCLAITTHDGVSEYGGNKGEPFTHSALDSYVRTLRPQTNDVFMVSLIIANLLAAVDLFDVRGRAWKHVIRTLLRIPVYNVTVFIVWLALTALMKFAVMDTAIETVVRSFQQVNSTSLVRLVRYHWLIVEQCPCLFIGAACVFGVFVAIWRKVFKLENRLENQGDGDWWAVFPMDSYLVNLLFRPMATLSRPRPSQDLGLEEGMELLIERLATPDLWLHPVVPTDYIKDLPLWRYDGWGTEEDLKSESETDWDSPSETEADTVLDSHTCCQDQNCHLCELWTRVKEIYVCHRCAILKRKLEKQYLRYRQSSDTQHHTSTYEKLVKVCESCLRTKRQSQQQQEEEEEEEDSGGFFSSAKTRTNSWSLTPQRLTELKWSSPQHAIQSRVCAICLERYRWSVVLCGLPCGHNYHRSCIIHWLLKDNHHCPTCRWPSYKSRHVDYENTHYD